MGDVTVGVFLELLAREAARYPGFTLLRSHEVVDVLREDGRVRGVKATGPDGNEEIRAGLTVAADGRHSTVRAKLGLEPRQFGVPMDVLWFRLSRQPGDGEGLDMRVGAGQLLLGIDRGDYWQVAYVIPKGTYEGVVAAGIDAFAVKSRSCCLISATASQRSSDGTTSRC